jgi:hypothetical protein
MQRDSSGQTQGRDRRGRWRKGVSGNPLGPPRGTRHRATRAAEELLEGEVENLTRKAVDMALGGDIQALRICLERLIPVRRDRPVALTLPPLEGVQDLTAVTAALLEAAAAGELTPGEAGELAKLVEAHRRVVETAELEERVRKLEENAQ